MFNLEVVHLFQERHEKLKSHVHETLEYLFCQNVWIIIWLSFCKNNIFESFTIKELETDLDFFSEEIYLN